MGALCPTSRRLTLVGRDAGGGRVGAGGMAVVVVVVAWVSGWCGWVGGRWKDWGRQLVGPRPMWVWLSPKGHTGLPLPAHRSLGRPHRVPCHKADACVCLSLAFPRPSYLCIRGFRGGRGREEGVGVGGTSRTTRAA